ncbi:MAG TPA: hypothetical protein VF178_04315 [Gemmatimonadaceae bacterium]
MEFSPFIVPVALFVSMAFSIVGVAFARAFTRRAELRARETEMSPQLEARLDRMEQAMEAIAVEVERIAEGQRFTTRLLSERGGAMPNDRLHGG